MSIKHFTNTEKLIHITKTIFFTLQTDIAAWVSQMTDGNGVGRIIEASGSVALLNNCFSWLRKVYINLIII